MGTKPMGSHISSAPSPSRASGAHLTDRSTRAILDGIRLIVRALRESSRDAERAVGLSGAQLFVLQRLTGAPALSLNQLADRTLTHQSSVSVVVAKLARRGLVARTRAADDARRLEISLTAAGREVLGRAPAAAQDRLIAALAMLGPAARRSLAQDLGRLVDAMALPEDQQRNPPMFFEPAVRRRAATTSSKEVRRVAR
jgi:DNA-binding MarR family transcriptional regulator